MSGAKRRTNYATPQTFTFTLKVSGLVGCAVGLVVLLSSFFALGVVVGRGYQPEAAVPELARLIPTPQGVEPLDESGKESPAVLKPEELQYMDRLKKGGTPPASHAEAAKTAQDKPESVAGDAESRAKPAPAKKAEPAPAPATVARKPAEAATTRDQAAKLADRIERKALNAPSSAPSSASAAAPATSSPSSAPVAPSASSAEDEDQTVYDYIYQAASFKQESMAQAFREKIAALGLGAAIQKAKSKSSTWYRVVVHFQGRPEETREMKAKLKTLGVNRPIMQSKKPL